MKQTMEEAHKFGRDTVSEDVLADPNWIETDLLLHGSRVLIRVVFVAKHEQSLIIRPGAATNSRDTRVGIVLAVGTGPTDKDGMVLPLPLEPGDYVVFSANTGMQVSHLSGDTDMCFIIGYHEVLGQIPRDHAREMSKAHHEIRQIEREVGSKVRQV